MDPGTEPLGATLRTQTEARRCCQGCDNINSGRNTGGDPVVVTTAQGQVAKDPQQGHERESHGTSQDCGSHRSLGLMPMRSGLTQAGRHHQGHQLGTCCHKHGGRRLLQVVAIRDPARDLSAHFSFSDLPVTPKGAGHTVDTGHTVAQPLSNFDLECEGSGEGAHISGWGIFLSRVLCSPGTDVPTCSENTSP